MSSNSTPLVSVVTPVYNGGSYLAQCIESVLSQTYDNWQYIIVDNCSTDNSLEIMTRYGRNEPRIVVLSNKEHLKAVANWNYSVSRISPASKYCKIVHADDWMFPECLSRMVELGEAHPSAAIVSCYVLVERSFSDSSPTERRILNAEIPYHSQIVPGHEIGRKFLLRHLTLTFTPSCQLIRCDSIRRPEALYDESTGVYSALDRQVGLELLENGDFAFVHKVLTCAREHSDSLTLKISQHYVSYPENLRLLKRFGHTYLTDKEHEACWELAISEYSRFLGRAMLTFRGRDFWTFHKEQLRQLGCPIKFVTLPTHALKEVVRILGEPLVRMEQRWQLIRRRDRVSPRNV